MNQQQVFEQNIQTLESISFQTALKDIKHGVERECLRINNDGGLATDGHPQALGSALTHNLVTTDFSESLLEFITPPQNNYKDTLEQLTDIHKFTHQAIGDQLLWPSSMPCFLDASSDIPIARYGTSNVAKMKEVYRQGLHNRYGSMMQVIAGVHFNFSLPESFWQLWCEHKQQPWNIANQSDHYFSMVRNFRRFAWVIPYLYGASPAICGSFIAHRKLTHNFEKVGKGTLYLPYATSLRMSDLGYTSSAQSSLSICYNSLENYVDTLRAAISQPAPQYQHLGSSDQDGWDQLNDNILQIENELYSPIRPKQVAKSMEMPTNALQQRGVSYLEVRSLDVDPYSPIGIDAQQFHFIDVFLLYCLLLPSPKFEQSCRDAIQDNVNRVVLRGREPGLELNKFGTSVSMSEWGLELIDDMVLVANLLDKANNTQRYTKALQLEREKFVNTELTPSGKWLSTLLEHNVDNGMVCLELAKQYKKLAENDRYTHFSEVDFLREASQSVQQQHQIEQSDTQQFSDFIAVYFAKRESSEALK